MSCLTTSATRRSRMVPAAVLIASAAASSHDVPLVPMTSVTLYTLMTLSFDRLPVWAPRRSAGPHPANLGLAALDRSERRSPPDLSLALGLGDVQDRCLQMTVDTDGASCTSSSNRAPNAAPRATGSVLRATLGVARQTLLLDVKQALVDEFVDAEGAQLAAKAGALGATER